MKSPSALLLLSTLFVSSTTVNSFLSYAPKAMQKCQSNNSCDNISSKHTRRPTLSLSSSSSNGSGNEEARKLLEKAAEIRKQLAELEGKTVSQVQQEAQDIKDSQKDAAAAAAAASLEKKESSSQSTKSRKFQGLVYVPETIDDQIRQASLAIERAFQDKITRQTIRLALVKQNESIGPEEEEWPGGSQQMYREAGRPLTEALLSEVRAVAKSKQTEEEKNSGKENYPPTVTAQDIWDFDVSTV